MECAIWTLWKKIGSIIINLQLRNVGGASLKFVIPYLISLTSYLVFNYGAHLREEEID